jgi:hypothetical protein
MPGGDQGLDQRGGEAVRQEQRFECLPVTIGPLLAAAADLQLVTERFVENVEFKIT